MKKLFVCCLLAACAPSEFEDVVERPADYVPPPGVGGMVLTGPTSARPHDRFVWEVRADDLRIGDRLTLGWGGQQGPGPCPYRQQVGGTLCVDITNPARPAQTVTAVQDPLDPNGAVAIFDLIVPGTNRSTIHLQALSIKGPASATSNVLTVDLSAPPPCPSSNLIFPADQATADSFRGCTSLDNVIIRNSANITRLDLPLLETVSTNFEVTNSAITELVLPRLTGSGSSTSNNVLIHDNALLTTFSAPEYVAAAGFVEFQRNDLLTQVDLRSLQSTGFTLTFRDNLALPRISVPSLQSTGSLLSIQGHPVLEELYVPQFTTGGLQLRDNTFVAGGDIVLNLQGGTTQGLNILENVGLTSMTFPSLTSYVGLNFNNNADLASISFPVLTILPTGGVSINDNPLLQTVDLDALEQVSTNQVNVQNNDVLSTLDFASIMAIGANARFNNNPAWCVPYTSTFWDGITTTFYTASGNLCNP